MKLKISDYQKSLNGFSKILESKPNKSRLTLSTQFSAGSFVPLAVVLAYVIQEEGPNEAIEARLKSTCDFYGVSVE